MVPLKYPNKKFILAATGPSLTPEVIETIRPYKDSFVIFGINDSYRVIDFLDEHYACDQKWWDIHGDEFREKYPELSSWTGYAKDAAKKYGLNYVNGKHAKDFSIDPNIIHYGANSGFQALNVAFLMGGSKFILVGYNMQAVGTRKHYFGNHPPGLNRNSPYQAFVKNFNSIRPEIRELVINCTTNTALDCFEKADLKETLENES